MQQHDAARRQLFDRRTHRVEAHAAGRGVVVRVLLHDEAAAFEHRAVVVPARVADPHAAVREPALEEIGADLQAAAGAHRLDRGHAARGHRFVLRPEQQLLHGAPRVGGPFHRQVRLGAAFGQHLRLGFAHAGQHRDAAVVVEVDADRQVDLVRPRIGVERIDQREDRIAGVRLDMFEHGMAPTTQKAGAIIGACDSARRSSHCTQRPCGCERASKVVIGAAPSRRATSATTASLGPVARR